MSIINSIITTYKNGSILDYINLFIIFPEIFTQSTEWVKKCIVSFKRHLNCLSIDAKVYKK